MINLRLPAFVLAVSILGAQEAPPAPPKPSGRVDGKVVNSTNGEPIRKATVTLMSHNGLKGPSYMTETDSNGVFRLDGVEPGEYTLNADRQGFMVRAPGAAGAPLPPVKVEKDQPVAEIRIPLQPLGVITGHVTFEDGEPARGASVRALQFVYNAGKRTLRDTNQVAATDKGDFRLYGLRPGTYYLLATARAMQTFTQSGDAPRGPKLPGPAPTYYPSTIDPNHAVPVELAAGTILGGLDIRVRTDTLYRVRGKFPPDETHQSNGGFVVQLARRDGDRNGNFGSRRTMDTFEFPGVQPGSYVVLGARIDGEKRSYAFQPVEVGAEDVQVGVLMFSPGADVSGTVEIEGPKKPQLGNLRVTLQADTPSMFGFPSGEVKPDGTFVLHDVAPAIYRVVAGPAPGTYLKAVKLGDRPSPDGRVDMTRGSSQLTVVLGSDIARVEGSVKKSSGEPAVRARVTLIPAGDREGPAETSRFAFTDEKGEYKMMNVPPGDYKVFAWEDVPQGAPQDADFRKPFEKRAVAIKVEPSGNAKADVTVISVADMQHPEQ